MEAVTASEKGGKSPLPAIKAPSEVAVTVGQGAWGSEGVDASDIIIPKILLMQGLSKLVSEEKAKLGEFRESLNSGLLGDKTKPLEVIAFFTFKNWVIFEEKAGKYEYIRQEPLTPENQDWKFEDVVNGVKVRRDKSLNYYVLLPTEIGTGAYIPYIISFRRTSYLAGKKVSTVAAKLRQMKPPQPLASRVLSLSANLTKNDKGTFYVFDIAEARKSTEAEMQAAHDWYNIVRGNNIKIDDSDLAAEVEHAAAEVEDGDFKV